jgi:aminoglycoside/choline kinase family phosphotransferase
LKEAEVIKLSNICNFKANHVAPLKQEASGREYWRVSDNKKSYVLCYLNPKEGNHKDFIKITNSLKDNGIKAVDIVHHDNKAGATLQEDLGDNDLLSILNKDNKTELIEKSLDLLSQIQKANIEEISRFEESDLINQMNLCKGAFLKNFLNIETNDLIDELIFLTIEKLKVHPWTNCHFDYERRNLILKNETITAIDYQDMKVGPMGIDLAGILIDHYYPLDLKDIKTSLRYFSNQINLNYNDEDLFEFLRYGCIQRNMRILGTLANLYLIHNRSYRLRDLPMILSNLVSMIPEELGIKEYFLDKVQPSLLKRISEI